MASDVTKQFDRVAPSYCHDILAKFGQNDYGENIFRVVWSEAQFETIGGVWEERANPLVGTSIVRRGKMLFDSNPVLCKVSGYKFASKYPDFKGKNGRWILEKWLPCSFSPELWHYKFFDPASGLYLSGPYPEQGEYWCSKVLTDRGAYAEPTADLIEYYARLIQAGDEYAAYQKKEAYEEREKRKKREYDNRFDAIYADAQLAGGTTNMFQAVSGRKTNRKTVDDVKFVDAPKGLPTKSGHRQL